MILATDLDGTFLGGTPENRNRLYQLIAAHPEITLVFVTGRGLEVVMPLLDDPTIPQPDFIICDVGATVVEGTDLRPVEPIQSSIDAIWPGEHVVRERIGDIPGIHRQMVPQQRRCSRRWRRRGDLPGPRRGRVRCRCAFVHGIDTGPAPTDPSATVSGRRARNPSATASSQPPTEATASSVSGYRHRR